MSLANLTHNCQDVLFNSSFSTDPSSYANFQWLQSVRLLKNGSAYGLVHNEFKAEFIGNRSECSCQSNGTHADGGNCSSWYLYSIYFYLYKLMLIMIECVCDVYFK